MFIPNSFSQLSTRGNALCSSTGIYKVKFDQLTVTSCELVSESELVEHELSEPTTGIAKEEIATFFSKLRLASWGRGGNGSVTSPH